MSGHERFVVDLCEFIPQPLHVPDWNPALLYVHHGRRVMCVCGVHFVHLLIGV
jgi:hypothetical protein